MNLLAGAIGLKDQLPAESEQERAAHDAVNTFTTDGFGYSLEQSTRPQTIGYSLLDSPVGLAAWMLDHDSTPKRAPRKQGKQPKASEVAKLRRAGKTWAQVRQATGSRFNSTRFGKLLNSAGYDRKGAKLPSATRPLT
jgi:hypothetical protein